jgi:hypothetical protein
MSDEYSTIYILVTSYLPRILFLIFFPAVLVGVAFNFMKNPLRNI